MVRGISQFVSLFFSLSIMIAVIVGFYLRPDRRISLIPFFVFGLVGFFYYIGVLCFRSVDFSGHDYSSIRVLIQTALISFVLWFKNWHNWRGKK